MSKLGQKLIRAVEEVINEIKKGNYMNDQITLQMADAQKELDKQKQEGKTEVFVQTPADVGTEEKPVE